MSINYSQALKKYLNQVVWWKKCTGHDEYGEAQYAEVVEINVRMIPIQKLITDSFGKQSVSQTTVLSAEDIEIDDMIDDSRVIAVEWSVDRWGKNIARKVFLL